MKNLLRTKAKSTRVMLNCKSVSHDILKQIDSWTVFKNAVNIMIYHPINNEIDLLDLTKDCDKNFYLPKIENNEICVARYNSADKLVRGMYNINEPCDTALQKPDLLDLIFLPALMVDKWGYRLGYGKGYYDRFLEKIAAKTITAVPVYEELYCDELPIEAHDKKADYIILTDRIIDARILLA